MLNVQRLPVQPYGGQKLRRAMADAAWRIELVKRSAQANGFEVIPRRWVVERAIAWINRCRRLAKDYENLNDTAFARHGLLRQALDVATWFCDAYASWQKGAVENINGRLRRHLPRKIDIDKRSDHDLQEILLMHDLTPRKCLRFKTPAQALLQQLGLDIKISFHRGVALHS